MQRHGRNVHLGYAVDAERSDGTARRYGRRKIREPAAVEHMVGRECDHLPAGAINADPRAYLEGMPLYAALELLVAVVSKPDRAAGEEHRRQRDIQRKRRVVFAAKAAADMGELGIDAGRLNLVACLAEQVR